MNTYILFGGGVNYSQNGDKGILRSVRDTDTPQEIRDKIRIAKAIHATSPHLFMVYDVEAMDALLESLPAEEVVEVEFNTSTASYEGLKAYVAVHGIAVKGNASKKELIKAIEALADTDGHELV